MDERNWFYWAAWLFMPFLFTIVGLGFCRELWADWWNDRPWRSA